MIVKPITMAVMKPPQDDLLIKIKRARLHLREGDVVAVTSKVVSIWEGRCISETQTTKDELVKKEAALYLERKHTPGGHALHTITKGIFMRSAGVDASNGNGYFILWPKNPQKSVDGLLRWFKKEYKIKNLGLVITDSRSIPLRRGAIGFALAYAGFAPIYDYRGKPDIFGRKLKVSQANIADALAAAAVLVMGEGNEQTPLAIIRGAPHIQELRTKNLKRTTKHNSLIVPFNEDVYKPFLKSVYWKKGGGF